MPRHQETQWLKAMTAARADFPGIEFVVVKQLFTQTKWYSFNSQLSSKSGH